MTELEARPLEVPDVRKGMPSPRLDEADFKRRFRAQYADPNFESLQAELEKITEAAWDAYKHSRKAPHTRKAGPGFADPDYDLSVDWIAARDAIKAAEVEYADKSGPLRVLLINGSSRSEHTCPGEMSKTYRLTKMAEEVLEDAGVKTELLDLSRLGPSTGVISIPARRAFRPRPRSATGPARATRTTRWARPRIG